MEANLNTVTMEANLREHSDLGPSCLQYYTIIDFNEVDIRIYQPKKVITHRGS